MEDDDDENEWTEQPGSSSSSVAEPVIEDFDLTESGPARSEIRRLHRRQGEKRPNSRVGWCPDTEENLREPDSKKVREAMGLSIATEDPPLAAYVEAMMDLLEGRGEISRELNALHRDDWSIINELEQTELKKEPPDEIDEELPNLQPPQVYYRAMPGREMPYHKVKRGRNLELKRLKEFTVYEWVQVDQSRGQEKIGSKWAQNLKFDDEGEEIARCRVVGMELAFEKIEDALAAAAPVNGGPHVDLDCRERAAPGEEAPVEVGCLRGILSQRRG